MDEALIAALRERVHDPRIPLRVRVHSGFLAAGDWNPDLHPRGHDGRFIEIGWLVNLIDMAGFRHGQRGKKEVQGEVVEIIPDPDKPGDPVIRVKMTDPRWNPEMFGEFYDARAYQVAQRDPVKGTIPKHEAPDIELLPDGPIPAQKPILPPVTPVASLGAPLPPMPEPPGEVTAEWVSAQMTADLTVFRGKETIWSMPGANPDMALGMAETYRKLTHDDTETALRIDYVITDSQAGMTGDPLIKPTGPTAIAVAHPGTTHPGGIGPKVGKTAIVLGDRFVKDNSYWEKESGAFVNGLPWSMSSATGSINQTLTHEFGHQRQFRMLALAMDEVGQPWSEVIQPDGFGTVPDSSNWPEIQQARYDIQKLAPTAYGRSKSSEAYAEVWSALLLESEGISSGVDIGDLQATWELWHQGMSIVDQLPQERFGDDDRKPYDDLTDLEKAAYWEVAGPVFDVPGMREHYPDSAALYDEWTNDATVVVVAPESDFVIPDEELGVAAEEPVPSPFDWMAQGITSQRQLDQPDLSRGEVLQPVNPNLPVRSTVGFKHDGFEEAFHEGLDLMEERFSDLTGNALAYVGTGLDSTGRDHMIAFLEFYAANGPGIRKVTSEFELRALVENPEMSIWELPSMSGIYGQVVTSPTGVFMLVNPTIDPNADPGEFFDHGDELSIMQMVMTHEYGHAVHRSVQRTLGERSPVQRIYNTDTPQTFNRYIAAWTRFMGVNAVTEYGSRNDSEALAEAFVRYNFDMAGGDGWEEFLEHAREADSWYETTEPGWGEPPLEWMREVDVLNDMIAEVSERDYGADIPYEGADFLRAYNPAFAEKVARWLETRKVVPGWEPWVLQFSDLAKLGLVSGQTWPFTIDPALRQQLEYILKSGITPEEIRRQAKEMTQELVPG